jgi:hypothetical protein
MAREREEKSTQNISENLTVRDHFESLGRGNRIILKWIFEMYGCMVY